METALTILLVLLLLLVGVPAAMVVIVAVVAVVQRTWRRIRVWRRRRRKPRWVLMVTEKSGDQKLDYLPSGMDMVLGFKVPGGFDTLEDAKECLRTVADHYGCTVHGNSFYIPLCDGAWTKWRIMKV